MSYVADFRLVKYEILYSCGFDRCELCRTPEFIGPVHLWKT
jgi:hypothetical protein